MYSWTSDQYSQYDSLVIAANVRDATDTLDGILGNQTALEIEEHTTDTHGYTEMIFGAYDLLDLRFAPRIRDLDCQRLYQHGTLPAGETSELLRHRLRPELITPHGDSLFRLAASLKHGWAPASLLLSRLQASGPRNPIARALQEYGRLVKTNFILEWLGGEQLRRRYGRQLNKGENLNGLRRVLFYAYEGQLTTTGELEGISPLQHAHLHAYGEYPIDLGSRPVGYRPLRQPLQREPISQPRSVNRV
jgi:TnpA family transposase